MTAVVCLGGPWHGTFIDPLGQDEVVAPVPDRHAAHLRAADGPVSLPAPRTVTYHLRSVEIVGWRVVLNCLTTWDVDAPVPDGCVLPGYVHGVPSECEPDRNAAEPSCICPLVGLANGLRQVTGRGRSYCHLDHCPVHGPFRDRRDPP